MSRNSPYLTKEHPQSGFPRHDAPVVAVGNLLANFGWPIQYDPVAIAPSGAPVHADLKVLTPSGRELLFEFKVGDSGSFLPMSAYAQAAQLVGSGTATIFVTNMKLSESMADMFRQIKVPVIDTQAAFDKERLFEGLEKAGTVNPEISALFTAKKVANSEF